MQVVEINLPFQCSS